MNTHNFTTLVKMAKQLYKYDNNAPSSLTMASKLSEAYFAEDYKRVLYWLAVLAGVYGIEPQVGTAAKPLDETVLALVKAIKLTSTASSDTMLIKLKINDVLASLANLNT